MNGFACSYSTNGFSKETSTKSVIFLSYGVTDSATYICSVIIVVLFGA